MAKQKLVNKIAVRNAFMNYLPENSVDYVLQLFDTYPVKFKIVPPRSTKLGDFSVNPETKKFQITINGNLNPYAFLVTTIHEFAHLVTYMEHKHLVLPHGEEWKANYRKLWIPVLDLKILPQDVEKAILNSLIQTKASSCSDHHLLRVLHKYDIHDTHLIVLEQLPKNANFAINGLTLIKGPLRRKRYLCEDSKTKRNYLVNALAKVTAL
jgi:SprT protein